MELVYSLGITHLLKEDDMPFLVLNNTVFDDSIEVIGCYQDKHKIIKRVKRDSPYGKKILSILNQQPEPLSQDVERLRELTSFLADKWDMKKVIG